MATPMQKEDFERRCKSLVSKLNDADFLANKGLFQCNFHNFFTLFLEISSKF